MSSAAATNRRRATSPEVMMPVVWAASEAAASNDPPVRAAPAMPMPLRKERRGNFCRPPALLPVDEFAVSEASVSDIRADGRFSFFMFILRFSFFVILLQSRVKTSVVEQY